MEIDAHHLWQESQRYILLASRYLNPRLLRPEQLAGPHDEEEWLRIAYLFPTLPERSKTDLLKVRRYFLLACEHQERERLNPDDNAEYSLARAGQVASQIKESLPTFSDVQRAILEKYYLTPQNS